MVRAFVRFCNGFDWGAVAMIFAVSIVGGLVAGGLVIATVFITVGP